MFDAFKQNGRGDLAAREEDRYAIAQGPWGGSGGRAFYDGRGDIVGISVAYTDKYVSRLKIGYEQCGIRFDSADHGTLTAGSKIAQISVDHPDEYIKQVEGTYDFLDSGLEAVTSLTFTTNKFQTHGPYGLAKGQTFHSPPNAVVVGFFGRSGNVLDQLGVLITELRSSHYVSKPLGEITAVPRGPWGGPGGFPFYDGRGDIVEIAVTYNENWVIKLQVSYEQSGRRFEGAVHGNLGGGQTETITLQYPQQYLKQVRGTFDETNPTGHTVMTSIGFVTNTAYIGPFGIPKGQTFQTPPKAVVTGFFGRSGKLIDQLGVLIKQSVGTQDALPKEINVTTQGPWGGPGGFAFYDGIGDIVEITVTFNLQWVIKLQATYEQSGVRFQGASHGSISGDIAKISLNYPEEFLKQVVGTHEESGSKVLTSITFITNQQSYGPFGVPRGVQFQSPSGIIVGFFGRAGNVIDNLGVFTKR